MPRRPAPPEADPFDELTHEAEDLGLYDDTQPASAYGLAIAAERTTYQRWAEIAEQDGRYILTHDGQLFVAIPVKPESIIAQALRVQDS